MNAMKKSGESLAAPAAGPEAASCALPVDGYCNQRNLEIADRVRLFDEICGMAQANHERGTFFWCLQVADVVVTETHGVRNVEISARTVSATGSPGSNSWMIAQAADLYRLGQLLGRMLPENFHSTSQVLARIFTKATSMTDERFPSVESLRRALRGFVDGYLSPALDEHAPRPKKAPLDRFLTPLPIA